MMKKKRVESLESKEEGNGAGEELSGVFGRARNWAR